MDAVTITNKLDGGYMNDNKIKVKPLGWEPLPSRVWPQPRSTPKGPVTAEAERTNWSRSSKAYKKDLEEEQEQEGRRGMSTNKKKEPEAEASDEERG